MSKDLRQLARVYRGLGWRIVYTNSNHLRWLGPRGERVVTSLTPSDRRAIARIKGDLRRATRILNPVSRPARPAIELVQPTHPLPGALFQNDHRP